MAIDGALSTRSLISRLQKIYMTLRDSVDIDSPFYTFIESYSDKKVIHAFSVSLQKTLIAADFRYDPSNVDHKFNQAIKSLDSDPALLEQLFDRSGYKKVKRCYIDYLDSLENLDRSYQRYLEKNSPPPPQVITPLYSQQCAQNQPKPFVVNDIYLSTLFFPENTFQNLSGGAREHFLQALVYLIQSSSPYLIPLLSCQANEDLTHFLKFIALKSQEASSSNTVYSNHYNDFNKLAETILTQRHNREPDDIENECKLYRQYGLRVFSVQKSLARPSI